MRINSIIVIIFFLFLSGQTIGQYLIIDNSDLGGFSVPFQDTILYCNTYEQNMVEYSIDLDQDNNYDVEFSLYDYIGGFGSESNIKVSTSNNFVVYTDTNYMEHAQYIGSNDQVFDTIRKTTVVKKYAWEDTLFYDQSSTTAWTYISKYHYNSMPPATLNNINLFIGDTAYIGFKKSNGDTSSLYYLKIYVPNRNTIQLISAKSNDLSIINIIDSISPAAPITDIFPNPVSRYINFNSSFDFLEIYTLQGILIFSEKILENQNNIDVSWLKSGYYLLKLKSEEIEEVKKFIKL